MAFGRDQTVLDKPNKHGICYNDNVNGLTPSQPIRDGGLPVPIDVAAVTSFFFVRSSSWGISSRYAAVKAPEVMTRISSVIVFMVVLLSLKPCRF